MKNILLFAILVLLYACKSQEELIPNRPPNAFSVKTTLKDDGLTIVLNWTKATDPDSDFVTYSIILKDTLIKNINDTTFIISNLDSNYNQIGKIIAKDSKGLTTEASFTAITQNTRLVNIPDALFEKYLVDNKIDTDGLVNGKMNREDAKGIKEINFRKKEGGGGYGGGINNLVGIEAFIDLERLFFGSTTASWIYLPKLDISKNTKLEELWLATVTLKELDISKNTNLKSVTLLYNSISVLDLSKNTELAYLSLYSTNIEGLDLSNNTDLENLYCPFNQRLTSIDISKNIKLKNLSCENIQVLDVSKNTNLISLHYSGKQLTNLDISKNIKLKKIICTHTNMTNLNVENNPQLEVLWCNNNNLESLNLSKNTELKELRCRYNERLKTICIANTAKILDIDKDFNTTLKVCE